MNKPEYTTLEFEEIARLREEITRLRVEFTELRASMEPPPGWVAGVHWVATDGSGRCVGIWTNLGVSPLYRPTAPPCFAHGTLTCVNNPDFATPHDAARASDHEHKYKRAKGGVTP